MSKQKARWSPHRATHKEVYSVNTYIVCMDSYRVRDAQMFDTKGFSDDELLQMDPFSAEMESRWFDAEVTPFVGVFDAQSEQEACEFAAKYYHYDVRVLYVLEVKTGGSRI